MSPAPTPSSSSPPQTTDLRARIVLEARSWVETPFEHQGRMKGSRVDCVGLIIGVAMALRLTDYSAQTFRPYAGYARAPNPRLMGEGMRRFLVERSTPKDELAPDGSIMWLEWREDMPMHLAIRATNRGLPTMIHAYGPAGKCCEHGLRSEWPGRIASWWDFPGVPEWPASASPASSGATS